MTKIITILIFTHILLSCTENNKTISPVIEIESENIDIPKILFTDIIPEHLTDSTKTSVIENLISQIDKDSNLVMKKNIDTTEITYAFYRNDSLIKIVNRHGPRYNLPTTPNDYQYTNTVGCGESSSSYYFVMNRLVCVMTECRSCQSTGRCNSIYSALKIYFYNDTLINHQYQIEGSTFDYCGCTLREDDIERELGDINLYKRTLKGIDRLKLKYR